MRVFIATKNKKKAVELNRILEPMGFEVFSEADLRETFAEVEETGTTFEENALIKAEAGMRNTGCISVADDSGLCVDALGGAPGIYSARYSGEHGNDDLNNKKLLKELEGVPEDQRTARYIAAIACVFPDGRHFTVRGECRGRIGFEETGSCGFGYDPLFISEKGCFGLLSADEKDSISHRGKALELFRDKLREYIGPEIM